MTSTISQEVSKPQPEPSPDLADDCPPRGPKGAAVVEQKVTKSPVTQDGSERRPETARSVALAILTTLAVIYSVYFSRAVLMPLVMALVLALLLRPLVRRARRWRIPDGLSAGILLAVMLGIAFLGLVNLMEPARDWVTGAPEKLKTAGERLHVIRQQIEEINEASEKVEQIASGEAAAKAKKKPAAPFPFAPDEEPPAAANEDAADDAANATSDETTDNTAIDTPREEDDSGAKLRKSGKDKPVPVEVQQPRLVAGISYLASTGGFLAEVFITVVIAYFLLAVGDVLINNVLHILPSMREKRNVVELIYSVEGGISSYLLTVTVINLGLGAAIAVAMWALGLPNPLLWGAMAAAFNYVPYLGALVGVGVVSLVSVLTFDSLAYAVVPPIVYWSLTALEGNFITPHMLGRSMQLNPLVVFLSLVFWGWIWGVGGALLAVPILAIAKVSLDQFEKTRPISTLLGGGLRS